LGPRDFVVAGAENLRLYLLTSSGILMRRRQFAGSNFSGSDLDIVREIPKNPTFTKDYNKGEKNTGFGNIVNINKIKRKLN
jgi:hypothetical protein